MLIGTTTYFSSTTGRQLASMDRDVPAPRRAPQGEIARWECRNGDPRDVRYYNEHGQIDRPERIFGPSPQDARDRAQREHNQRMDELDAEQAERDRLRGWR